MRSNDFVIAGYGNTPTEWQADHDQNVRAFLDRCREKNLKLHKNKARLKQREISFIGHILTSQDRASSETRAKLRQLLTILVPIALSVSLSRRGLGTRKRRALNFLIG